MESNLSRLLLSSGNRIAITASLDIQADHTGAGLMDESKLLERITVNPEIFGGKPIIRGRRLAVEHILVSTLSWN